MQRYLKVRGKPGVLVANPHVLDASPRRYAGQQRKANAAKLREEAQRYEPVEEVLVDDRALRKAARMQEIEVLAEGTGASVSDVRWIEITPQVAEPAVAPPAEEPQVAEPAPADEAPQAAEPAGKDS